MGESGVQLVPSLRESFTGFLFDMDGTIIDSTPAIIKHWHNVGKEIGVDPETILQTSHGRRSIDVLKILAPAKANWEYVREMEGSLPKLYGHDAVEIPGARNLLDAIDAAHNSAAAAATAAAPPSSRSPAPSKTAPWAIVTSGTEPLVSGWLGVLGLPTPEHLVTAESVENGKPDPTCYCMGLDRLFPPTGDDKVDPASVLVLEDSPAGIRAGKAAGCRVLGLVTSHTEEQVIAAGPDWVVKDLDSVRVVGGEGGKITLEMSDVKTLS